MQGENAENSKGSFLPRRKRTFESRIRAPLPGGTAITALEIPECITSVGKNAFSGCSSLVEVHYSGAKAKQAKMEVASGNEELLSATWFFAAVAAADVDGSGEVDSDDRTILARYLAHWGGVYDTYFE